MTNHADKIYNVITENEFFDAWRDNKYVIFDEAGLKRDAVGTPDSGADLILRMINSMSFPLHMAHLEDKGNCYFRAEVVIATSNRTFFDWKSLYCSEAYTRRFKVCMLQSVKKEFCIDGKDCPHDPWKRRVDLGKAKYMEYEGETMFDTSIYEFFPYDCLNGQVIGSSISYDELVELCVVKYRETRRSSKILLNHHEVAKRIALKKRRDEEERIRDANAEVIKAAIVKDIESNYQIVPMKVEPDVESEASFNTADDAVEGIALVAQTAYEEYDKSYLELEGLFCKRYGVSPNRVKWYNRFKSKIAWPDAHDVTVLDKVNWFWVNVILPGMCDAANAALDVIESIKEWCSKHKIVVWALGIVSTAIVIWSAIKDDFETQSGSTVMKANKKPTRHMRAPKRKTFNAEGSLITKTTDDVIRLFVMHNCYTMRNKVTRKCYGQITFLGGLTGITCYHVGCAIMDDAEEDPSTLVEFLSQGTKDRGFTIKATDLSRGICRVGPDESLLDDPKGGDWCEVTLPDDYTGNHKLVIDHIVSEKNPILSGKFSASFLRHLQPGSDLPGYGLIPIECQPSGSFDFKFNIYGVDGKVIDSEPFHSPQSYQYRLHTYAGESGSPIFITDERSSQAFLVGFHIAGSASGSRAVEKVGRCAPVFKEWFEYLRPKVSKPPIETIALPPVEEFLSENGLNPQYILYPNDMPMSKKPVSSQIIRSPLYGTFGEPKKRPALLKRIERDGVTIDPWYNARSKYCKTTGAWDVKLLSKARDVYINSIMKVSVANPWPHPRIFDFETAIKGIPGIYEGIPRGTSAGYPWSLYVKKKGKKDFFGDGDEYDFSSEACQKLKEKVFACIDEMLEGERLSETFFDDFLKDERRLYEKVMQGLTRLISGCPLHLFVLVRMYFGDFVLWYQRNMIVNGSAVGINPYSNEWETLYRYLTSISGDVPMSEIKGVFGDFSAYDGTLAPALVLKTLDVAEAYYYNSAPKERLIRRILFEEFIMSKHIINIDGKSYAYSWLGANPSGNPLTTIINTVSNNISCRYCIYDVVLQPYGGAYQYDGNQPLDCLFIESHFRMSGFGDDNVLVFDDQLPQVNQTTLSDAFERVNMKYTDEDKTGSQYGYKGFDKGSYLKRGFRFDLSFKKLCANLSIDTIEDMVNWQKKTAPIDNMETVVRRATLELSLHGKEVFEAKFPILARASIEKLGYYPPEATWENAFIAASQLEAYQK
jgi:hypothetical protein